MSDRPISRYPVPDLAELPDDIRRHVSPVQMHDGADALIVSPVRATAYHRPSRTVRSRVSPDEKDADETDAGESQQQSTEP